VPYQKEKNGFATHSAVIYGFAETLINPYHMLGLSASLRYFRQEDLLCQKKINEREKEKWIFWTNNFKKFFLLFFIR
jgi:hypothetical protein